MSTTSVKLPNELKARAARAAKTRGLSVHAFMLDAIRRETDASERRAEFMAAAVAAREQALASGNAYTSEEVHAYLRKKSAGEPAPRPKSRAWRG